MKKSITTIAVAVIIAAIIFNLVGCSGSAGAKTTKTSSPALTSIKTNTFPVILGLGGQILPAF
jgi:hypothetical protein